MCFQLQLIGRFYFLKYCKWCGKKRDTGSKYMSGWASLLTCKKKKSGRCVTFLQEDYKCIPLSACLWALWFLQEYARVQWYFRISQISIVIYHLGIEHWIAWLNVSLVHYKMLVIDRIMFLNCIFSKLMFLKMLRPK